MIILYLKEKIGENMKRRNIFLITILLVTLVFISSLYYIRDKEIIDPNRDKVENKEPSQEPSKDGEDEEPVEEKKTSSTILVTGDIMYHEPQIKAAYDENKGRYDFTNNFKYVKDYIRKADLSIGNFETVTAGEEYGFTGFPQFNSPVETLDSIKDAGFDILTTVNNHSLDQGKPGIINTIDAIEDVGMKNIGTYKEPNKEIFIQEVNNIDLALLAYSYGYNGLDYMLTEEELSYMVNTIDEERIEKDIKDAKDLGVDMIMVFIHWGDEYHREPSSYQKELGHKMLGWGANMVLGSHPHVIQKSEIVNYNNKENYIIYSMGNFLSNQREETMGNRYTEDGIMVELKIEKDFLEEETYIKDVNHIPTWVRKYNDGGIKYEIIPSKDFLDNDDLLLKLDERERIRIKESYENTMKQINK